MMVAACDNRKKTVAPAPPAPRQTHRAAIASASARTRPPHPGRGASPGPWRRAGRARAKPPPLVPDAWLSTPHTTPAWDARTLALTLGARTHERGEYSKLPLE